MEFRLSITLGNDAMDTYCDVAEALRGIAARIEQDDAAPALADDGVIRDENGNTVGRWEVTA